MPREIIKIYSHSQRLRNFFQNVAANIPLVGRDVKVQIELNGSRYWHKNGILHRDDGPAEELSNGIKRWYIDGLCHRIGGPAIESIDTKSWLQNDILHRDDGPAIEKADGRKFWFVHGREIPPPRGPDEVS